MNHYEIRRLRDLNNRLGETIIKLRKSQRANTIAAFIWGLTVASAFALFVMLS
jgi:hypothetical protein